MRRSIAGKPERRFRTVIKSALSHPGPGGAPTRNTGGTRRCKTPQLPRNWGLGGEFRAQSRRRRGVTLIELLVAALIVSIVAAGAVSSWSISSKVPATLRATEIASKIAVREIEQIKAKRYINLSTTPTTAFYDTSGAARDTGGVLYGATQPNGFTATTTVALAPGMPVTNPPTTKDLLQVTVVVTKAGDITKVYETQRTLMTFGGF